MQLKASQNDIYLHDDDTQDFNARRDQALLTARVMLSVKQLLLQKRGHRLTEETLEKFRPQRRALLEQ